MISTSSTALPKPKSQYFYYQFREGQLTLACNVPLEMEDLGFKASPAIPNQHHSALLDIRSISTTIHTYVHLIRLIDA